jgi:hypothetical protein
LNPVRRCTIPKQASGLNPKRFTKADPWGGLFRVATTFTEASTLVASPKESGVLRTGAAEGG